VGKAVYAMTDNDLLTLRAAEQFLVREARLLDTRDYEAWLELLADDVHYVVRAQEMRDSDAGAVSYTLIDEDGVSLRSRIDQIRTGRLSRAENPPSLVRRLVSNVEVVEVGTDGALNVVSYVMAFRARGTVPQGGFYVGQRADVLRVSENKLRISSREVLLDHAVLFDGALSTIL
jgi:3-phenylpropionate/cinnamic acid dioxygenase small subunit